MEVEHDQTAQALLDALTHLGYTQAATVLQQECNLSPLPASVTHLRRALTSGDWLAALASLNDLPLHLRADAASTGLMLSAAQLQRSLCEDDAPAALRVLHHALAPLAAYVRSCTHEDAPQLAGLQNTRGGAPPVHDAATLTTSPSLSALVHGLSSAPELQAGVSGAGAAEVALATTGTGAGVTPQAKRTRVSTASDDGFAAAHSDSDVVTTTSEVPPPLAAEPPRSGVSLSHPIPAHPTIDLQLVPDGSIVLTGLPDVSAHALRVLGDASTLGDVAAVVGQQGITPLSDAERSALGCTSLRHFAEVIESRAATALLLSRAAAEAGAAGALLCGGAYSNVDREGMRSPAVASPHFLWQFVCARLEGALQRRCAQLPTTDVLSRGSTRGAAASAGSGGLQLGGAGVGHNATTARMPLVPHHCSSALTVGGATGTQVLGVAWQPHSETTLAAFTSDARVLVVDAPAIPLPTEQSLPQKDVPAATPAVATMCDASGAFAAFAVSEWRTPRSTWSAGVGWNVAPVTCMAWSPDGSLLAVGGEASSAVLLYSASGHLLCTAVPPPALTHAFAVGVTALTFIPFVRAYCGAQASDTGVTLVALSSGSLITWDLVLPLRVPPPDALLHEVQEVGELHETRFAGERLCCVPMDADAAPTRTGQQPTDALLAVLMHNGSIRTYRFTASCREVIVQLVIPVASAFERADESPSTHAPSALTLRGHATGAVTVERHGPGVLGANASDFSATGNPPRFAVAMMAGRDMPSHPPGVEPLRASAAARARALAAVATRVGSDDATAVTPPARELYPTCFRPPTPATILVLRATDGMPLRALQGHVNARYTMAPAWSAAQPSLLAVCSEDALVYVWDVDNDCLVAVLQGHERPPTCASWNSRGRARLATGGDDGCICIWDA